MSQHDYEQGVVMELIVVSPFGGTHCTLMEFGVVSTSL